MELLMCFIVHILVILVLKAIVKRSNNIKVQKVLCIILLMIVPLILWESVLGINRKKIA